MQLNMLISLHRFFTSRQYHLYLILSLAGEIFLFPAAYPTSLVKNSFNSVPLYRYSRSFLASGAHSWGTNLPYEFFDIDTNFPFKGYLCWENDFFSFKLARDKIDLGPGYWSTVELNKQNPYWDYFQFSYKGGSFRLTEYIIRLNATLITQEEQDMQDTMPGFNNIEPAAYQERAKNIVLHEFKWLFGDSLALSIGEFIVIGGKSLQVSDINPMLVFHNFYGEDWRSVWCVNLSRRN